MSEFVAVRAVFVGLSKMIDLFSARASSIQKVKKNCFEKNKINFVWGARSFAAALSRAHRSLSIKNKLWLDFGVGAFLKWNFAGVTMITKEIAEGEKPQLLRQRIKTTSTTPPTTTTMSPTSSSDSSKALFRLSSAIFPECFCTIEVKIVWYVKIIFEIFLRRQVYSDNKQLKLWCASREELRNVSWGFFLSRLVADSLPPHFFNCINTTILLIQLATSCGNIISQG